MKNLNLKIILPMSVHFLSSLISFWLLIKVGIPFVNAKETLLYTTYVCMWILKKVKDVWKLSNYIGGILHDIA